MFKTFLATLAVGASLAGASAAATVANGGFEAPGTFSGAFEAFASLDGWSVDAGSVDLINTYWNPSEGAYSVDLSGNSPATISQTISGLTSGAKYLLSFDMAGNMDGGAIVKSLLASVGGTSGTFTFDTTGHSNAAMGWERMTLAFTAEASSLLLSFASLEADNPYGAALDNVSVAAVPLPAAGLLMLGGLGALVAAGRRRRA